MKIEMKQNGTEMTAALEGRLDTVTAPELEKTLEQLPEEITDLVYDFSALQYISSAGLRVVLASLKRMKAKNGTLVIRHANEMIMEVLDVTGFLDILTVEND